MAYYSCSLGIVAAVLITLVIILTALIVVTILALKKLVGTVVWFFTPSSKPSGSRLEGAPGGSGSDYSGSLCANYCDAKDPTCSEACLRFPAAGPLFR
jgi:hypothetical protein